MLNSLKIYFSLLSIVSVLAISLTGCSLSNGYGETRGSSKSEASAQPAPTPNSDMSNMEMPQATASPKLETASSSIPNQVMIENFSFRPVALTVKAGTEVNWINRDDVPHTATDVDKRFNSSTLDTDNEFTFTFKEPGTYNYYCALHPKMVGQIIVK